MIFMERKLVSGTGKSRGAGPDVLASPPHLPLTRLRACFAGKRSLARWLAFAEEKVIPLLLSRVRRSDRRAGVALAGSRASRSGRRGAVAAALALWQGPPSHDLWGSCAHRVVRRPRGGERPRGGSFGGREGVRQPYLGNASDPLLSQGRGNLTWAMPRTPGRSSGEATFLGQCQ